MCDLRMMRVANSTRNRSVTHWTLNRTDQMLQLIIRSAVFMKVKACKTLRFVRSWYPLRWPRGVSLGSASLSCWHCRFESRRKHGCLCLVSVVCCQVEVPAAMDRSLVESSATECVYVTECDQGQQERSHD